MYAKCHDCMSNTSSWKHLNANHNAFRKCNHCNNMIHIYKLILHKIFLENVQYEVDDRKAMYTKFHDCMLNTST